MEIEISWNTVIGIAAFVFMLIVAAGLLHYIITTASGGTADAWTLVLDFIIMGIGASGLLMAVQTKSRQVFVLGILLFIIGVVVSYLLAMG